MLSLKLTFFGLPIRKRDWVLVFHCFRLEMNCVTSAHGPLLNSIYMAWPNFKGAEKCGLLGAQKNTTTRIISITTSHPQSLSANISAHIRKCRKTFQSDLAEPGLETDRIQNVFCFVLHHRNLPHGGIIPLRISQYGIYFKMVSIKKNILSALPQSSPKETGSLS